MNRIEQNRPGTYRALRQNRKIINKRLRKLDSAIAGEISEKQIAETIKGHYQDIIHNMTVAGFFKRLRYAFTGDLNILK